MDRMLLLRQIEIKKYNIINIFQWYKNISIINLYRKNLTIDISNMEIINYYDYENLAFMKKIKFQQYGESIITLQIK